MKQLVAASFNREASQIACTLWRHDLAAHAHCDHDGRQNSHDRHSDDLRYQLLLINTADVPSVTSR